MADSFAEIFPPDQQSWSETPGSTQRTPMPIGSSWTSGKIMPRAWILLMLICVVGCAESAQPVSPAKKASLRAMLDFKSGAVVPADREADFYAVIEAFAESRRSDEFVQRVEFGSKSEATLLFTDGGMHGGGSVTLRKGSGKWTIVQKTYLL